jgi:TolB-like protein/Tfp pilus assembly protein PilF
LSFFTELRRRNVLRVGAAYVTASWLLLQVADTVFPVYGLGADAMNALITALAIGLPLFLLFSWVFEITPEGLKWEKDVDRSRSITARTCKQLDRVIIGLLTLALGYFAIDKFVLEPARDARLVRDATLAGRSEALKEAYGEKSIAVLPFADLSPEGDQEYFSDGIAEELLNLLAKIPELRVISRTSAFAFKGKDTDIPSIAGQLDVAHILEGSVRKAGNRVRVTAQLIEARSDTHLWSETFDRTIDDIFAIQDEIAAAVVNQLKVALLGEVPKAHAIDSEAYGLFLQGRHFLNQGSTHGYQNAFDLLQQALSLEPAFADAWAEMSRVYNNLVTRGQMDRADGYAKAMEALDKALALDPANAVALSRLGWSKMTFEGDLAAAAEHFEEALRLAPGNAIVLANASSLSRALGRVDESIALQELALQRDPLSSIAIYNLGWSYLVAKRFDAAEAIYRKALVLSPDRLGGRAMLARALYHRGMLEEALQLAEEEPYPMMRQCALAILHHAQGNSAESDAAMRALREDFGKTASSFLALAHMMRGEIDRVFESLQAALEIEGPRSLNYALQAPEFESLRSDPRWNGLFSGTPFSEERLAAVEFAVRLPD